MKNTALLSVAALAMLILAGCTSTQRSPDANTGTFIPSTRTGADTQTGINRATGTTQTGSTGTGGLFNDEATIEITKDGFRPAVLNIDAGDTVRFVNKDTMPHWPASARHPTHTLYPGSNITKCGTAEQPNIFDACRGLRQDEAFTFTFREK